MYYTFVYIFFLKNLFLITRSFFINGVPREGKGGLRMKKENHLSQKSQLNKHREEKNITMGIQRVFAEIGEYGCYLLSILKAIDKTKYNTVLLSIINDFEDLKKRNIIGDECTVLDPEALCRYYGANVKVEKTNKWPNSEDVWFVIGKYHNKRTGYSHFVLMKGPREVSYDPLGDSVTVREGDIESYRVFKRR